MQRNCSRPYLRAKPMFSYWTRASSDWKTFPLLHAWSPNPNFELLNAKPTSPNQQRKYWISPATTSTGRRRRVRTSQGKSPASESDSKRDNEKRKLFSNYEEHRQFRTSVRVLALKWSTTTSNLNKQVAMAVTYPWKPTGIWQEGRSLHCIHFCCKYPLFPRGDQSTLRHQLSLRTLSPISQTPYATSLFSSEVH